jgi:hypothetical protein
MLCAVLTLAEAEPSKLLGGDLVLFMRYAELPTSSLFTASNLDLQTTATSVVRDPPFFFSPQLLSCFNFVPRFFFFLFVDFVLGERESVRPGLLRYASSSVTACARFLIALCGSVAVRNYGAVARKSMITVNVVPGVVTVPLNVLTSVQAVAFPQSAQVGAYFFRAFMIGMPTNPSVFASKATT